MTVRNRRGHRLTVTFALNRPRNVTALMLSNVVAKLTSISTVQVIMSSLRQFTRVTLTKRDEKLTVLTCSRL